MSDGGSSSTKNWSDCCCPCIRDRIKVIDERVHKFSAFVGHITALLSSITIITMFVGSYLNVIVEPKALPCRTGIYKKPYANYNVLLLLGSIQLSTLLIVYNVLQRCFKKKVIALPKCLALCCYVFGIAVILFYLPIPGNSSCDSKSDQTVAQKRIEYPPIMGIGVSVPESQPKSKTEKCTWFEKHSAVQFLRDQGAALWISCGLTWVFVFAVWCVYLAVLCTISDSDIRVERPIIRVDSPSCSTPSPTDQPAEPWTEAQASSHLSPNYPSGAIAGGKQIVRVDIEPPPRNSVSSSESLSDPVFLEVPLAVPPVKWDQIQYAEYDLQTGKCLTCMKKHAPLAREESMRSETSMRSSHSDEAGSRDDPRSSHSNQSSIRQKLKVQTLPKSCNGCGLKFSHAV